MYIRIGAGAQDLSRIMDRGELVQTSITAFNKFGATYQIKGFYTITITWSNVENTTMAN